MRLYLGCVVATALLASRISAEVNFVATSKRLSGVYGEPLLANQQNAKDSKEIPLQYATDEKIGLLRGTATEQTTSPLIDKTTYFTPRQAAGDEYGAKVIDAVVPWENKPFQPDNAKNSASDEHEYMSDRDGGDVDASVNDPNSNAGDIVGAGLNSEDPVQSETDSPDEDEEHEMKTMVVNDEYVRWDQDDCNPCEVPTQVPTLAPIYPRGDDDYEDHLPIVTDDHKPWEELKEDLPADTEAPTENPALSPNYSPRDDDYEEHLPIVNDEYDSWDELKESFQPYPNEPTDAPTPGPDTIPPPADSTAPEDTTAPQKDSTAPEDTTVPPNDTTAPKDTTAPLADTKSPEDTTAPPKDTTAPEDTTTPLKDTAAPDDTQAPPKDSTAPTDTTAPPKDTTAAPVDTTVDTTAPPTGSTPKPHEPTPAPTKEEEPTQPNDAYVVCPVGQQSIGVVGWDHDGCVTSGHVCVADTFGACPSGAHCTWLDTGVYGCKDGEGCSSNEQTIGVVGWDYDGCIVSDNVCVAQVSNGDCPKGAYCALLDTGVYGCVASSKKPAGTTSHGTTKSTTGTAKTGKTSSGTKSTSGRSGTTTTGGTTTGATSTGATTTSTSTYTWGIANANTGTTTTGADTDAAEDTAGATSDSNTTSTGSPSDTLSAGAIAGIAIGCAVFVAVVVGSVLFWQKAHARQHEELLFADLSDTGGGDYAAM